MDRATFSITDGNGLIEALAVYCPKHRAKITRNKILPIK
jgi:hypothetical protein